MAAFLLLFASSNSRCCTASSSSSLSSLLFGGLKILNHVKRGVTNRGAVAHRREREKATGGMDNQ